MNLTETFKAARGVSTPLFAIQTPDPAITIRALSLLKILNASKQLVTPPIFRWDMASGLSAANEEAKLTMKDVKDADKLDSAEEIVVDFAPHLPPLSILFMFNAHRYIDKAAFTQGVWNLRDAYKANKRALVLLAPQISLPIELTHDVLILDQPYPTKQELAALVLSLHSDAGLPAPKPLEIDAAVAAVSGIAAFPAEGAVAMSLGKTGMDVPTVWIRKKQEVNKQRGLHVDENGFTFKDLAGIANIKNYFRMLGSGENPPDLFGFLEEIDKSAGGAVDTSGVKEAMKGKLLVAMEDARSRGIILLGPGGSGKSAIGKAAGNELGVPTIGFDFSGMQDSLVGNSEAFMSAALKTVNAMSNKNAFWIATCNRIEGLSPELRRRFRSGIFFVDLPDAEERLGIWALYRKKCGISESDATPPDEGWTGAEIRSCCENAKDFRCSLLEASAYVVPLATSAHASIEALRAQAHGCYISASYPGPFDRNRNKVTPVGLALATSGGRQIDLEE